MLAVALTALTWILPFLFVLTLVVTVHEFGHFLAARGCGVAIDQFSIGFGRALARWRDRSGVEWRIGWLPLGGYVRFSGDENAASVPDAEDLDALRREITAREGPAAVRRYYQFKPIWQRSLIAASGPMANFILSTVLFAAFLMVLGEPILPPRVSQVVPGSPAAAAGFQPGDLVVRAAGKSIDTFSDLAQVVTVRAGTPVKFTIDRGGSMLQLTATPRAIEVNDGMGGRAPMGQIGVEVERPAAGKVKVRHYDPISAIGGGAAESWDVLSTNLYYFGRILQGQLSADELHGPLGIAQASHAVAQSGAQGAHGLGQQVLGSVVSLLALAAYISVMIGFMNLLPIPVLDGGHLLFYAYEAIARRPVGAAVQ
ncbi:MAG TPA: M50 family metallopeptidase, partial [Caulobacteraceae bacterium]|nr:M50 family metallopeptidase [Caulobacteraceae bacterium]